MQHLQLIRLLWFQNDRKQYWCIVYTCIYNNHSLRFYSCQSMVELWYGARTCIISWYTSNHKFSYSPSSTSGCALNSTCIVCGHVLRIQHSKLLHSRCATSRKNAEIGTCIISWNALYIRSLHRHTKFSFNIPIGSIFFWFWLEISHCAAVADLYFF